MYTTQVTYDLLACPDKMTEIYRWFETNGPLSETASLTYSGNSAILTIVNCTGGQPPNADCQEIGTPA